MRNLIRLQRTIAVNAAVLGIASSALFPSESCRAEYYVHSWQNRAQLDSRFTLAPEVSYYATSTNFDTAGSKFIPTGSPEYRRFSADLNAAFGITHRFTLYARANWNWIELSHNGRAGSAFGFGEQTLGANFAIWKGLSGAAIHVQAQAELPLYSNTQAAQSGLPFIGDGSYDFTGGTFFVLPLSGRSDRIFEMTAGAGFVYRTAQFSSAIPYSVVFGTEPASSGVILSGGIAGFQSIKSDSSGKSATDTTISQTSSGGSFIVNAVNPSTLRVQVAAGYQINSQMQLLAAGAQSLWGNASPNGYAVSLGFRLALDARPRPQNALERLESYGGPNEGFMNYDMEARVTETAERLAVVKIDKGLNDGVQLNQVFDIFVVKQGATGGAIARGKVSSVNTYDSLLTVTHFYKEVLIERGFVVRRPVQQQAR